jgi:GDP-L-fucose synthase
MSILFTGHNGFLGRELIPRLSANHKIITYPGDLCEFTRLSEFVKRNSITKVIHAAAKVANRWEIDTSENLIQNLKMTMNVVNLGIPMLSFCSGKIYGYQKSIDNVGEDEAGDRFPEDYYGQSKYIIRKLVLDNDNVSIFRFFNVFGIHEHPLRFIKANITKYSTKKPMIIDQNIHFDFFYVEDAIPIIASWISESKMPKELNLIYKEKYDLFQVCSLINELAEHRVRIIVKNPNPGRNYYGNGERLSKLDYPILGISEGLRRVFSQISK